MKNIESMKPGSVAILILRLPDPRNRHGNNCKKLSFLPIVVFYNSRRSDFHSFSCRENSDCYLSCTSNSKKIKTYDFKYLHCSTHNAKNKC